MKLNYKLFIYKNNQINVCLGFYIFALTAKSMNKPSINVLICPLDWGLGHATRCIPIIRELINHNANVMIAADGSSSELLQKEFPGLRHLCLHGYRIKFSKYLPVGVRLAIDVPRILLRIIKEHILLAQLIKDHDIDMVISDNRYGLWSKKAYSIFITHQPNIIPPSLLEFSAPLLRQVTRFFISKYNECWIPDSESVDNLSGKLSHGYPLPSNVRFIGLLSRFDKEADALLKRTVMDSAPQKDRTDKTSALQEEGTGKAFDPLSDEAVTESDTKIKGTSTTSASIKEVKEKESAFVSDEAVTESDTKIIETSTTSASMKEERAKESAFLTNESVTASDTKTEETQRTQAAIAVVPAKRYDIVAIISGPEPHRSIFENKLIHELQEYPVKSLLLRGITGIGQNKRTIKYLTIVDHLTADELSAVLMTGPVVICRAGYSTLMDLAFTGNRLICIPTPGQTEQEYMALCGAEKNRLVYAKQKDFSINQCINLINKTNVPEYTSNTPDYKQVITDILNKIKLTSDNNDTNSL